MRGLLFVALIAASALPLSLWERRLFVEAKRLRAVGRFERADPGLRRPYERFDDSVGDAPNPQVSSMESKETW